MTFGDMMLGAGFCLAWIAAVLWMLTQDDDGEGTL